MPGYHSKIKKMDSVFKKHCFKKEGGVLQKNHEEGGILQKNHLMKKGQAPKILQRCGSKRK